MNKNTARKLLDVLEHVDHGGFGGPSGLTIRGRDRIALYGRAVEVRGVLLQESMDCSYRPLERASWLLSVVQIDLLLESTQ